EPEAATSICVADMALDRYTSICASSRVNFQRIMTGSSWSVLSCSSVMQGLCGKRASRASESYENFRLRAKLPEVVVDLLVRRHAPFRAGERTEERVDAAVAAFLAAGLQLANQRLHPFAARFERRLVVHDEVGAGGAVFPERLLAEELLPEDPAEELAREQLFGRPPPGWHLQRARRMFEHLRRRHLAPLPYGAGLDRIDPPEQLLARG